MATVHNGEKQMMVVVPVGLMRGFKMACVKQDMTMKAAVRALMQGFVDSLIDGSILK